MDLVSPPPFLTLTISLISTDQTLITVLASFFVLKKLFPSSQNCFSFCKAKTTKVHVVYFDQWMGTLDAACWSKNFFLLHKTAFFYKAKATKAYVGYFDQQTSTLKAVGWSKNFFNLHKTAFFCKAKTTKAHVALWMLFAGQNPFHKENPELISPNSILRIQ